MPRTLQPRFCCARGAAHKSKRQSFGSTYRKAAVPAIGYSGFLLLLRIALIIITRAPATSALSNTGEVVYIGVLLCRLALFAAPKVALDITPLAPC